MKSKNKRILKLNLGLYYSFNFKRFPFGFSFSITAFIVWEMISVVYLINFPIECITSLGFLVCLAEFNYYATNIHEQNYYHETNTCPTFLAKWVNVRAHWNEKCLKNLWIWAIAGGYLGYDFMFDWFFYANK